MGCWNLHSDSCFAFWHYRITEANHINAFCWKEKEKKKGLDTSFFTYSFISCVCILHYQIIHNTAASFNFYNLPSIASANCEANRASPSMTGQMGWLSPAIVKPASVICDRNLSVLAWTFSANPALPKRRSNTCKERKLLITKKIVQV